MEKTGVFRWLVSLISRGSIKYGKTIMSGLIFRVRQGCRHCYWIGLDQIGLFGLSGGVWGSLKTLSG